MEIMKLANKDLKIVNYVMFRLKENMNLMREQIREFQKKKETIKIQMDTLELKTHIWNENHWMGLIAD